MVGGGGGGKGACTQFVKPYRVEVIIEFNYL